MPVPVSSEQFLELTRKSGLVEPARLQTYLVERPRLPTTASDLAAAFVAAGLITNFQSEQLLLGKWRGFTLGKFKILERIGAGGMGSVYLCEHQKMKHRVAVKVLPIAKAADPAAMGRFQREARAAGVLDHPNLVRAYDIDQEGELHYLVMDYVDGVNLQHLVARTTGPLPIVRACNYIAQAALGLQAIFESGLIHRDIKPANLLLDRNGVVKILDLGLARFFEDNVDNLTVKFDDNNVLGTADYLSPEQAVDSHVVDIRTDIYSLGGTFYFLLTGRPLFPDGKIAQKLVWHQKRDPKPIKELRPDLPAELVAVIDKMLAKKPAERFDTPNAVLDALAPWVHAAIDAPTEEEIPPLCPAARATGSGEGSSMRRAAGGVSERSRAMVGVKSQPSSLALASLPANDPAAEHATPYQRGGETDVERSPLFIERPVAPSSHGLGRRCLRWIGIVLALTVGTATGLGLRWSLTGSHPANNQSEARVLVVNRSGNEGTFRTIREALLTAQPGDRVIVRETEWEEVLRLDRGGSPGQGVRLEGDSPNRKPVVWRAGASGRDAASLVHLAAVAGFELRNFELHGEDVVKQAITLAGPCPGLKLEDLHIHGFRVSGVRVTNGIGTPEQPIQLSRLQIQLTPGTEAGVFLEAYSDQHCGNIRVSHSRIDGPGNAGIVLLGPTHGIDVAANSFTQLRDGIVYRKQTAPAAVQVTIDGNQFRDIEGRATHFETPPPVEGSCIQIHRNRFERVACLAEMAGFRPEPVTTSACWIRADGSAGGDQSYFRRRFTLERLPSRAVLSVASEQSAAIWVNGQRLSSRGPDTGPRQVPALDIARYLVVGDNVLAVEAAGPAVLVELRDNATGVLAPNVVSDATWKVSRQADVGWHTVAFDDRAWPSATVRAAYGAGEPAWQGLIWHAVVQEHFKYQWTALFPPPTGNERDAGSREAFPYLNATQSIEPRR